MYTATETPPIGGAVFNMDDLCRLFRCSLPTIRKAIADGTIPKPLRLGTRTVWPKVQIEAVLAGGAGPAIQTAAAPPAGAIRTAALRV